MGNTDKHKSLQNGNFSQTNLFYHIFAEDTRGERYFFIGSCRDFGYDGPSMRSFFVLRTVRRPVPTKKAPAGQELHFLYNLSSSTGIPPFA